MKIDLKQMHDMGYHVDFDEDIVTIEPRNTSQEFREACRLFEEEMHTHTGVDPARIIAEMDILIGRLQAFQIMEDIINNQRDN